MRSISLVADASSSYVQPYEELSSDMVVFCSDIGKVMVITPRQFRASKLQAARVFGQTGSPTNYNRQKVGHWLTGVYQYMLNQFRMPANPIWASQFVTIGGLGCQEFNNAIESFTTLYHMFGAKVRDNNIHKFMAASFNGHACLNFACRYFSGHTNSTVMPIPK
jgi:hypothetical protein